MIPISDDNRGRRSTPVVTFALIAINIVIFLYEAMLSERELRRFIEEWGAMPVLVTEEGRWFTLLTSAFLHGGWLHLGGNMLFLWVFGDNVEDVMEHISYLIFYLLTGVAASATQVFLDTSSEVPLVGASGAISGVLGAYIVLFPHGKIVSLLFIGLFFTTFMLPAWVMIGYWIVIQFVQGLFALGVQTMETGGVAFFAHVGGFVAGFVLVWLFRDPDRLERQRLARHGTIPRHRWPQRG